MKTRFKEYAVYVPIGAAVFFLGACQQVTDSFRDTFNVREDEKFFSLHKEYIEGFVADGEALAQAEEALRALPAYQSKSLYLYGDVHFYDDGRISAKVKHPDNEEYIDAYNYQGGVWSGPLPVQISVRDDLQGKLVPLDSVPFSTVATITQHYNEKAAGILGAEPTNHVYLIIRNGFTQWYPNHIDGDREAWHIFFHRDGSVAIFGRN